MTYEFMINELIKKIRKALFIHLQRFGRESDYDH